MSKRTNCLREAEPGECPIRRPDCNGCAWDRREDRRRALPLSPDPNTGLLRKFVGTKKEEPKGDS